MEDPAKLLYCVQSAATYEAIGGKSAGWRNSVIRH